MMDIDRLTKTQVSMSGYEAAGLLYGNSQNSSLASQAYDEMRDAGWIFETYDYDGEEVWAPPSAFHCGECDQVIFKAPCPHCGHS